VAPARATAEFRRAPGPAVPGWRGRPGYPEIAAGGRGGAVRRPMAVFGGPPGPSGA